MNLMELSTVQFEDISRIHNQEAQTQVLRSKQLFVLLLGPSGVGKSTIIHEINKQTSDKYTYISPFTTRVLRPGETEKISVGNDEFDSLERHGAFVLINSLYNVRYGTPLASILDTFDKGKTPILDFPLAKVSQLVRPEYNLLNVYVFPPNINEWKARLDKEGRNNSSRFEDGVLELTMLSQMTAPHKDIHYSVVSRSGDIPLIANKIDKFVSSLKTN